jgi:transcription factor SOX7/8/10/18 (SOX group E/F)
MGYAQGYVSDPNSASQTFLGRSPTQQQVTENQVVSPRTKKAAATVPRPLNRWVIFRDAEYKRLKAENPNLTVQQICKFTLIASPDSFRSNIAIAKLCSKKWAAVPEEVKMTVWEDKAVAARAEHKRMYPNYRYAPRKAGEKKKRQSRKAKHAAAATARQQSLDITQSSGTPTMTFEDNFVFEDASGLDNTTTSQASMTNDWAPMVNSPFSTSPAVDGLHAETLRHERLQVEVGTELGFADSFGLFGDDIFAFRDGADGSATLPSIFSEGF